MSRDSRKKVHPVALVTGASGGIGLACATELDRAGFTVFGTSRKRRGIPGMPAIRMLELDVRDGGSASRCVRHVLGAAGRIDVLVNNAGVAIAGALEETADDEFRNVFETNVFGAARMIKAVLPTMREQRSGRIVNIGSIMAFLPMPFSAAYCASKHALRGLSESVDYEVRDFGIRVVVIEPGFIRTAIVRNSPVARSHGAYSSRREKAAIGFERRLDQGAQPAVVARAVVEAATTPNPSARYLPDPFARAISVARGALPSRVFDFALRRYLQMD